MWCFTGLRRLLEVSLICNRPFLWLGALPCAFARAHFCTLPCAAPRAFARATSPPALSRMRNSALSRVRCPALSRVRESYIFPVINPSIMPCMRLAHFAPFANNARRNHKTISALFHSHMGTRPRVVKIFQLNAHDARHAPIIALFDKKSSTTKKKCSVLPIRRNPSRS